MSSRYHRRKAFFEKKATTWDDGNKYKADKIAHILAFAGIKKNDVVLDVGCGTGVLIPQILEIVGKQGKIVALDYAQNMISRAQKKFPQRKFPNLSFYHTDFLELSYHDYFDIIFFFSCFPHFDEHEKVLLFSKSLLHRNGRIIIAHTRSREYINHMHMRKDSAVAQDYLPSVNEVERMCDAVSLTIENFIDTNELYAVSLCNK